MKLSLNKTDRQKLEDLSFNFKKSKSEIIRQAIRLMWLDETHTILKEQAMHERNDNV